MLLRADNEAQVAFVLSHEFGHYYENHSLEQFRSVKATNNVLMALTLVAGGANLAAGAVVVPGEVVQAANLYGITTIYAYSREKEAQADDIGCRRMAAAGYDPGQCAQIWVRLSEEHLASQFSKVRKADAAGNAFSTHPLTADRLAALKTLAGTLPAGGDLGADRLRAAIRPFLGPWLEADLRRGDFGETLFLIGRLKARGEDKGVLTYYEGEAYRLRRGGGDAAHALQLYEAASYESDAPALAWRQMGAAYARLGRAEDARAAYAEYLARAPNAQDRALIEPLAH